MVDRGHVLEVASAIIDVGVAAVEFGGLYAFSPLTSPKSKINTAGSPQSFKADPQRRLFLARI